MQMLETRETIATFVNGIKREHEEVTRIYVIEPDGAPLRSDDFEQARWKLVISVTVLWVLWLYWTFWMG